MKIVNYKKGVQVYLKVYDEIGIIESDTKIPGYFKVKDKGVIHMSEMRLPTLQEREEDYIKRLAVETASKVPPPKPLSLLQKIKNILGKKRI